MSWISIDVLMIRTNATNYYFAPTELNYAGTASRVKNQVVQEADSGELKILTLSDTETRIHEFTLVRMPNADRTAGGLNIRGWNTFVTLVTGASNMNYRANTCDIWLPGTSKAGSADFTARYWSDTIFAPFVLRGASKTFVGDGSQIIRFRQEV